MRGSVLFLTLAALIFLTSSRGAGIYRPEDWVTYADMRYVTSIAVGPRYVYFGTTGGIGRLLRYQRVWDTPLTTSDGLPENWVTKLAYDPGAGELWAETRSGHICHYQPTFEDWIYGGTFPSSLAVDVHREFESPFFFMEFGYYFSQGGTIGDRHLRDFPISVHVDDGWYNLWLGTWGLGAGVGNLRTKELVLLPFGLMDENVSVMALDGDDMWFGSDQMGTDVITRFDRRGGQWTYFEAPFIGGLRTGEVSSIDFDTSFVWLGTLQGISRYSKASGTWTTLSGLGDDPVTDLAIDGDELWVGTPFGLSRMNRFSALRERVDVLDNHHIYDVEVGERYVWVGTDNGVYRRSRWEGQWQHVDAPAGHLSSGAVAIDEEGDDVWFCLMTQSSGEASIELDEDGISIDVPSLTVGVPPHVSFFLSVLRQSDRRWERYFPPEGFRLASSRIVAHGDCVWVGTEAGVLKFEEETEIWRHYTVEDGLADDEVQAILLDGDHIWFGTPKGATRFCWNSPYRVD